MIWGCPHDSGNHHWWRILVNFGIGLLVRVPQSAQHGPFSTTGRSSLSTLTLQKIYPDISCFDIPCIPILPSKNGASMIQSPCICWLNHHKRCPTCCLLHLFTSCWAASTLMPMSTPPSACLDDSAGMSSLFTAWEGDSHVPTYIYIYHYMTCI